MDFRQQLSKASLLAGLAMSQTQTALAHALSYDLTLQQKLPHGHACAVWLNMAMDIAAACSPQVNRDLEQIFACPLGEALVQLATWLQRLGVEPRDMRHTPAGQQQLQQALGSARGRNFIGSA